MKTTIAIAAAALTLGGCASDPYVSYGGAYYDGYRPYTYEPYSYSYGPQYVYPPAGATFYFRDDDRDYSRHNWRDRGRDDDRRDNWRGRDGDGRGDRGRGSSRSDVRPQVPADTWHGEPGNEAGMR